MPTKILQLAYREEKDGFWYVREIKPTKASKNKGDWGYVKDVRKATPLNIYHQKRFNKDSEEVGRKARFVPVPVVFESKTPEHARSFMLVTEVDKKGYKVIESGLFASGEVLTLDSIVKNGWKTANLTEVEALAPRLWKEISKHFGEYVAGISAK